MHMACKVFFRSQILLFYYGEVESLATRFKKIIFAYGRGPCQDAQMALQLPVTQVSVKRLFSNLKSINHVYLLQ